MALFLELWVDTNIEFVLENIVLLFRETLENHHKNEDIFIKKIKTIDYYKRQNDIFPSNARVKKIQRRWDTIIVSLYDL